MDEQAVNALLAPVDHGLPPLLMGHEDDLGAERFDPVELRAWRVCRSDCAGPHACLPRRPGDSLRHVAGARGDDAVRELAGRRRPHGRQRAA